MNLSEVLIKKISSKISRKHILSGLILAMYFIELNHASQRYMAFKIQSDKLQNLKSISYAKKSTSGCATICDMLACKFFLAPGTKEPNGTCYYISDSTFDIFSFQYNTLPIKTSRAYGDVQLFTERKY